MIMQIPYTKTKDRLPEISDNIKEVSKEQKENWIVGEYLVQCADGGVGTAFFLSDGCWYDHKFKKSDEKVLAWAELPMPLIVK